MAEIWDLFDAHGKKSGKTIRRDQKSEIPFGLYHLVVEIWTVRPDGKLLLTQRHPDKTHGLMWEGTGGSVVSGETSLHAAHRELQEETGIDAPEGSLTLLGTVSGNRYLLDTYLYRPAENDVPLRLQETEVVNSRWVTEAEMAQMESVIPSDVWDRYMYFRKKIWQTP